MLATNKFGLEDLAEAVQVVSEKNIQFLITEKVNKARQQHSGAKKIIFRCKKIVKWYHFMVRCKSYGPLSDEW